MRKIFVTTLVALAVVAVAALVVAPTAAAGDMEEGKWSGWITDENCGAKGTSAGHKACALKCYEEGQALVLYDTDSEEMYRLSDQEMAKDNLGYPVVVKGTKDGDSIEVASIEKAEDGGEMDGDMGHDDDHGHGHDHGEGHGEGHGHDEG